MKFDCYCLMDRVFYCNIFVFLFDIKGLNIFVCFGGGVGYMRVCVGGALVFVHTGCD